MDASCESGSADCCPLSFSLTISLPLVKPIQVRGKTIAEAEIAVKDAYCSDAQPILSEDARILVTMMRKRNYKAPVGADGSGSTVTQSVDQKLMELELQLRQEQRRLGAQHPVIQALKKQIEFWRGYKSESSTDADSLVADRAKADRVASSESPSAAQNRLTNKLTTAGQTIPETHFRLAIHSLPRWTAGRPT